MKITAIQLNFKICDVSYNFNKIKNLIYKNRNSEILVFSELCILGYYPYDLLLNDNIILQQNLIKDKIIHLSKELNITIIIGFAYKEKKSCNIFNSVLVIKNGHKLCLYNKQLLPNYDIFNEKRHFFPGSNKQNNIFIVNNRKIAVLICEDVWFKKNIYYFNNDPLNILKLEKIDVLILINASPAKLYKHVSRLAKICKVAVDLNSYVVYVSQIGGYDGIIYDGNSFICNNKGQVIKHTKSFKEDYITLDLCDVKDQFCIKKNIMKKEKDINNFIIQNITLGIKDYIYKSNYHSAVIALSGGIDSALTLFLTKLALGSNNTVAIYMPSIFSSKESFNLARLLCKNLSVKLFIRDITKEFNLSCKNFVRAFGNFQKHETKENIQARIRGRILMEYANDNNCLCVSTSNKSELSIGYTTIYGDMCGAINCLGDIYKTEIYDLAKYINIHHNNIIPEGIITREPSAELSKNQKDSDKIISYDKLDAFLKLMLEFKYLKKYEILKLKKIVKKIHKKDIENIVQMFNNSKFKRNQMPQIISLRYNTFNSGYILPTNSKFIQ